ncbi:MAG: HU family DNA-binding protein [Bacteroidaceae bacterium]|nr:HU family DNA-binding protein [Bacteroidaceae bacterium]
MDAKLNQSDLISLLAKGGNISVAKAELFTKNFFELIIEGLEKDGIVKINGLGTFKITDVASRGSVNVNTGEKIEIKGHRKLSFTPADALRDIVNQPFAMFEPVEVDDSYQPETVEETENDDAVDTAESVVNADETVEVVEIEAEQPQLNDENTETESTATEESVETAVEEETEDAETVVEEPVSPEVEEQTVDEEPAVEEEPKEESAQENNPDVPVKNHEPVVTKKKNNWKFVVFALIGFAVGFVAVKMMERNHTADVDNTVVANVETVVAVSETEPVENTPVATDSIAVVASDTIAVEENPVDSTAVAGVAGMEQPEVAEPVALEEELYTFVMVKELAATPLKDITLADTLLYVADGELTRHKVAANETLTKIARTYYGDKKLWPYIVKFNNMRNPNGLGYGMEIGIPRLLPRK